MKNRRKQRWKREMAAQERYRLEQEAAGRQSLGNKIEQLIGTVIGAVIGLLLLYWFYSGMITCCASWLSCTPF